MKGKNTRTSNLEKLRQTKKNSYAEGRALRKICPRRSHAKLLITDRDPVTLHLELAKEYIEELLPIRYQRLLVTPFAHFRGAAGIMAHDLAQQNSTGINIQICGDCHLLNFGGFATPERRIIFDINDFDETTVGPWEWDLKRLAASFAVAAEFKEFSKVKSKEVVRTLITSYSENMRKYAKMSALQVWYEDIAFEDMILSGSDEMMKKLDQKRLEKIAERTPHEKEFEKMTLEEDGKIRIADCPPLIFHVEGNKQDAFLQRAENAFMRYRESLSDDRKLLLENYQIHDVAMKVVGVGSVGTWCGIFLLLSDSGDPLFLQFKEAFQSIVQPFTAENQYTHNGQRVVEGQKLMQSASDIFLGWTTDDSGRQYYIRQMRDAKIKPIIEKMKYKNLIHYARSCGWALAQAHARTGNAAVIAGYIGKGPKFKIALTKFAIAYERQNLLDYTSLKKAVDLGIINLAN